MCSLRHWPNLAAAKLEGVIDIAAGMTVERNLVCGYQHLRLICIEMILLQVYEPTIDHQFGSLYHGSHFLSCSVGRPDDGGSHWAANGCRVVQPIGHGPQSRYGFSPVGAVLPDVFEGELIALTDGKARQQQQYKKGPMAHRLIDSSVCMLQRKDSEPEYQPDHRSGPSPLHHPCHILADDVKLKVHQLPHLETTEARMLIGVWDDGHCETCIRCVEGRQAHSIHCDGTFLHREMSLVLVCKTEEPAAVLRSYGLHRSELIHVSLHNVTVKAAIGGHATFQIYHIAHVPLADGRLLEGFVNGGHGVGVAVQLHHRETHTIVGHTLVYLQLRTEYA